MTLVEISLYGILKLFGNAAYPAYPTFSFNQTQLTQSNLVYNFKI